MKMPLLLCLMKVIWTETLLCLAVGISFVPALTYSS